MWSLPVVNMIKVVGVDRIAADSSASERLEGSKLKGSQRDSMICRVSHCQSGKSWSDTGSGRSGTLSTDIACARSQYLVVPSPHGLQDS